VLPVLMKNPNYELRTLCNVVKINLDSEKKRAVSVTYVDSRGREFEQPADLILLTSYVLNNTRLMLLSGIGKPYDPASNTGVVGRNYAYQTPSSVTCFFEDKNFIPSWARAAWGSRSTNSTRQLRHSGWGSSAADSSRPARTARAHRNPPGAAGHAALGRRVEKGGGEILQPQLLPHHPGACQATAATTSTSIRLPRRLRPAAVAHDLRPARQRNQDVRVAHQQGGRNRQGHRPVENERQPAARAIHHRPLPVDPQHRRHRHGRRPQQQRRQQIPTELDVHNLFVVGAGNFPQNGGYNPTGTVGALTYQALEAIKTKYLKKPGALV